MQLDTGLSPKRCGFDPSKVWVFSIGGEMKNLCYTLHGDSAWHTTYKSTQQTPEMGKCCNDS